MTEGREGEAFPILSEHAPCPLCGGMNQEVAIVSDDETKWGYAVHCECGASAASAEYYREDKDGCAAAVEVWNQRASTPRP